MSGTIHELDLLRRADKYYLGGGDGVAFAPPHPLWIDQPGFWDGVHVYMWALRPAFTVSIVDEAGRAVPLQLIRREWTPAEVTAHYEADGLSLRERRSVLAGGLLTSEWLISNYEAARELALVVWTAQEGGDVARDSILSQAGRLDFDVTVSDAQLRGESGMLHCSLLAEQASGWCALESQHMRAYPNTPRWETTPFVDHWRDCTLPNLQHLRTTGGEPGRTLIYMGIAQTLQLHPGSDVTCAAGMRVGLNAVPTASLPTEPADRSAAEWAGYYHDAPALSTSDPYVEHYFPYRLYGLRLNFLDPAGLYSVPTCAEGTEYFHCAISYSAWCHARELRWLHDPARARGVLRTFFRNQREDGSFPGAIYVDRLHPTANYFADWGGSVLAVHEVHPDDAFLAESYGPLLRFGEHMNAERDREESGLYDVLDPHETGQETMSRYTVVDATADTYHFQYKLRLKGIDISTYMYRLWRALAIIAAQQGDAQSVRTCDGFADRTADAIRARMWDAHAGMFFDLHPDSFARTGVRAAVCFYPYLTDIVDASHLAGLTRNLFDPAQFWTPFPVPSTAANDETFSPDAEWKQVRQNCTWNGRVWPMTNSHLVEALGVTALRLAPELRARAAELLAAYLRMLFFDGDPERPNCFEHYSPLTGRPCVYRGLDDYQHSWVNDLIIRYVAGFRPTEAGFIVDPFPCDIDRLELRGIPLRGSFVDVAINGSHVTASVNGHEIARSAEALIEVPLK